VALAAPRGTAKSTAVTHAYTIGNVLLGDRDFVLIISDTETQAAQFLGDIKAEFQENDALIKQFGIKPKFVKDTETDIIVDSMAGRFRIIAKGSEQKVRGLKWNNKRPNLIVIDDSENDESVMNPERREKFRNWFLNALLPCGGDHCIYRMVGTILHLDSMLFRLINDPSWRTDLWQAHNKDFTELLWPEKFPRERLERIRLGYESQGNLEGYAQEYLNNPIMEGNTYFRKQDFIPMDDPDHEKHMIYISAADFAISEKEKADNTVIITAGICDEGFLYIVDVRRGRIGSIDIIDELISVGRRYNPEIFTFETEKIDKAIGPFLDKEMRKTGVYLNIDKVTPSKSKTTRGKSIQAMMKSGSVRFDKKADWYPDFETEMMTITPAGPKGKHDDQFDAFAYIGLTVHKFNEAPTTKEIEDEEWDDEFSDHLADGRCVMTGY
jgi:predicted phage terminase large subunit-like protein